MSLCETPHLLRNVYYFWIWLRHPPFELCTQWLRFVNLPYRTSMALNSEFYKFALVLEMLSIFGRRGYLFVFLNYPLTQEAAVVTYISDCRWIHHKFGHRLVANTPTGLKIIFHLTQLFISFVYLHRGLTVETTSLNCGPLNCEVIISSVRAAKNKSTAYYTSRRFLRFGLPVALGRFTFILHFWLARL